MKVALESDTGLPRGWWLAALCWRCALCTLGLLLLHLLGLESGVVDEPDKGDLEGDDDEDDDEDGEQDGLVVEDGDGLRGGADLGEPVERAHCGGGRGRKLLSRERERKEVCAADGYQD